MWCKLCLNYLPLNICWFWHFFNFLLFNMRSSLFLKTITIDKTFEIIACDWLIFVVNWTSTNDVEFWLIYKRQMTISLLWFRVMRCDILTFTYKFCRGCELNRILLLEKFELLVAHKMYRLIFLCIRLKFNSRNIY